MRPIWHLRWAAVDEDKATRGREDKQTAAATGSSEGRRRGAATPAGDDAATGEGRADGGSNGPPRIYAEEDEAGRDGGRNDRRKTKPAVTATGGRSGDGSATGGSEPTKAAGAPDPRRADAMAGGSGADGPAAARLETDVDGRRGRRPARTAPQRAAHGRGRPDLRRPDLREDEGDDGARRGRHGAD